ncbi:hypothetical protein D7U91_07815 [Stenotrophomonas maltophilia]|uniref:Uncharacterized protein n=2 Tax=Stenotrophomonas maltophilia group TaxID=995085 RepID=A0A246I7A8_STEMA|nr:hypothetical protein ARC23_16065 [Stenotrophomonas maltophilia]PZT30821.1 hypothetical protein A7X97_02830 [Stenotrophomonas sepilia]MBA0263055.1 hypothetical protein [Stenotrophomonas maltophilia]MBA0271143.1 hypothetical protein [Stenotrophomonas maltophilia]MBA0387725.1 hypothetical protein [Stenotrophomonas maltophilia]
MLLLLILTFQSALSEPSTAGPARAKRRGCLSAASSRAVPRRAEERRAPVRSTGSRPAERFFWLLFFAYKEK